MSTRQERIDALEEALESIDELVGHLADAGLLSDDTFRAYHRAELEGDDAGWLGGPFLVDAIKQALAREINPDPDEDDDDDD